MPVAPYNWPSNGFLTAEKLNDELRRTASQYYESNGPNFYARRPLLRSMIKTVPTPTTSFQPYQTSYNLIGQALSDSSPIVNGEYNWSDYGAIGGATTILAGQPGANGLWVVIANTAYSNTGSAGTTMQSAVGLRETLQSVGQTANCLNGHTGSGMAVDVADVDRGLWTPWVCCPTQASNPLAAPTFTSDFSGAINRMCGFWVNFKGTAAQPATIPSLSEFSASTEITASMLNSYIYDSLSLLYTPPLLRIQADEATSVPNSTNTTLEMGSVISTNNDYDTWNAWTPGTSTYTIPVDGLYLCYLSGGFASAAASDAGVSVALQVNSTTYIKWGPTMNSVSGQPVITTKMQVLSLVAGDTITPLIWQNTGSTMSTATGTSAPVLVIAWLGSNGAGSLPSLPTVPDLSADFTAGLSGSSLVNMFNSAVYNDISFLLNPPWACAFQATATTGSITSSSNSLPYDTFNTAMIHDQSVPWGSWSADAWTCPVPGYYLVVSESFMVAGSNQYQMFGSITVSPEGTEGQDTYQACQTYAGTSTGVSAMGIYYMNEGDQIWSGARTSYSGSLNTYTGNTQSHMEIVWISQ